MKKNFYQVLFVTITLFGAKDYTAAQNISVTINQKAGQADPTCAPPVVYTVVFGSAIDPTTFTAADISFSGSAPGEAVTSIMQVAPNNGTTFEVSVTATGAGTIIPNIPAAVYYTSNTSWATTGTNPNGITIDASGNIYVANWTSNNVTKITPAGVSTILGNTGSAPNSIKVDAAGNIYTANVNSNTVTKITSAGVSSILGTTGNEPYGITMDASGNIFTTNYLDNTVSKITPAGVSSIFGTTGNIPYGITIDAANNLYISDNGGNNVTKIISAGISSVLGTTGFTPYGITMDATGNIYTANWNSGTVTKITPAGASSVFGTTGVLPYGITIDASGNIYTTNYSGNNVTRITPCGITTTFGTTGTNPSGITLDATGNIYTSNYSSNTVSKLTPVFTGVYTACGAGNSASTSTDNTVTYNGTTPVLASTGATITTALSACINGGYIEFVDPAHTLQKYMSINPNGNIGYNFTTAAPVATNNIPAINHQMKTDGSHNTTALCNRIYTVQDVGTNNYPSSMTVRLYYAAADTAAAVAALDATVASSPTSKWFKFEGTTNSANVAAILAAQAANGITGATYLTPSATGTEGGVNYVEFNNITHFSTFGYLAAKTVFLLPVTLTAFTGVANGCMVDLQWKTAIEQNSSYYSVEYSNDGQTFAEVGRMASRNSADGATYGYRYALGIGSSYFRLKMMDIDGKFTYSATVAVAGNGACANLGSVTVSPNPTTDMVNISGTASGDIITVFGGNGQKLTALTATDTSQSINVSMYAKGVYILHIQSINGSSNNIRVVKQ